MPRQLMHAIESNKTVSTVDNCDRTRTVVPAPSPSQMHAVLRRTRLVSYLIGTGNAQILLGILQQNSMSHNVARDPLL